MLATFLLLGSFTPGAEGTAFAATSPAEERPIGRLMRIDADGSAALATRDGKVVVRDFIGLRQTGRPLPPLPRGPLLILTNDDRIPGQLLGGTDRFLRFQPGCCENEWKVPISSVAVFWGTRPPAETPADPSRYSWLPSERNRDLVRFRNGDVASGTFEGFAADQIAIVFKAEGGKPRTVPVAELSAIAFNPTLARNRKPKGPYYHVVLRDGTRLDLARVSADSELLKGRTPFHQNVEFPLADVVSLNVFQGKAKYLAELKPAKAEQAGFLGVSREWRANRSVRGRPLRLFSKDHEDTFDRGLGTHPATKLTYELGGKYRRFEAVVGLDAATGRQGQAAVRILVDGKEQPLPRLAKLEAGPAIHVRVDVARAKELTLIVDFGPRGGVEADVNWADARLVE